MVALALGVQFVPVDRSNPPAGRRLNVDPELQAVFRRSCFDCHSNETRWPWYAHVAPISWLIARDVHKARRRLNFSHWSELDPGLQQHLAPHGACQQV